MPLPFEVSGDLAGVGLPSVLQMLSSSPVDGSLEIETESRRGLVQMRQGAIVGAHWIDDQGIHEENGLRALGAIQVAGRGRFRFAEDEQQGAVNLCFSTDMVLLELCRLNDEIERARDALERLGDEADADTVCVLDADGDLRLARLNDQRMEIRWGREIRRAFDRSRVLGRSTANQEPVAIYFQDDYLRLKLHPLPLDGLLVLAQSCDREDGLNDLDLNEASARCERFLAEPLLGKAP